MSATRLATNYNLDILQEPGEYIVASPLSTANGVDVDNLSGTDFYIVVTRTVGPTNVSWVHQRVVRLVDGVEFIRISYSSVGFTAFAEVGSGGGAPGAGYTLLGIIDIVGSDVGATTDVWTNSNDAKRIFVQLQAPGGGSGAVTTDTNKAAAAGGGGSGAFVEGWFDVDGVVSLPYTLTKSNAGSNGVTPAEGGAGFNVFNDPIGVALDGLLALDGSGSPDAVAADLPNVSAGGAAGVGIGVIGANLLSFWDRVGAAGQYGYFFSNTAIIIGIGGAGANAPSGAGGAAANIQSSDGGIAGQAPDAGGDAAGAGASGAVAINQNPGTLAGAKGGKAHLRIWEYA